MEGLASRSELRKEIERERRRIRDRQRRQSMSHEEREKHLARRRRNYQLRRQRAETARSSTPSTPTPIPIKFRQTSISPIQLPLNNAAKCVSDVSFQFDSPAAAGLVGSNNGQGKPMLELDITNSQSLEIPAHKLAVLPRVVRLIHVKHLARIINHPDGDANGEKMNVNEASNGLPSKGLRLNRIKRIARAINPAVEETITQITKA